MASIRAHIASFLVKRRIRNRLERITDVRDIRKVFGQARPPLPKEVSFRSATLGGTSGEWAETSTPAKTAMLYIHGGGFVACSPQTHRPITAALARRGFRVFAPAYRLAPEYPFPAAVNDVVAAWRALRKQVDGPIVIAGDSAGGTLCLALLISLRDHREDLPKAAALFSPATDLAGTGASLHENGRRDPMFRPEILERFRGAYLGDADPTNPLVSPLYADLAGLPPLFIEVGQSEVLRDDGVRLAERACRAGVHAEVKVWPVVPHVWQMADTFIPEARRSLDAAANFLHGRASAAPALEPQRVTEMSQ
jgi:monoterpene epsilon-lactone hydrolase